MFLWDIPLSFYETFCDRFWKEDIFSSFRRKIYWCQLKYFYFLDIPKIWWKIYSTPPTPIIIILQRLQQLFHCTGRCSFLQNISMLLCGNHNQKFTSAIFSIRLIRLQDKFDVFIQVFVIHQIVSRPKICRNEQLQLELIYTSVSKKICFSFQIDGIRRQMWVATWLCGICQICTPSTFPLHRAAKKGDILTHRRRAIT